MHVSFVRARAGKPCIAAALVGSFRFVIGIEALYSLCAIAQRALARYESLQRKTLSAGASAPVVEIINGSFLDAQVGRGASIDEYRCTLLLCVSSVPY
jgi:hypothetical protein